MVVNDKVYDFTEFIEFHPGGYEIMLEHAGTDASNAFYDKGHSLDAVLMLDKYCIGELIKVNIISVFEPVLYMNQSKILLIFNLISVINIIRYIYKLFKVNKINQLDRILIKNMLIYHCLDWCSRDFSKNFEHFIIYNFN